MPTGKGDEKPSRRRSKNPPLKQRTRSHVIASLSANSIERFILESGHTVLKTDQDYGVDLIVFTYDKNGYVEAGNVFIQLKASSRLRLSADRTFYSFPISIKDYNAWSIEPMPVFLVLYDFKNARGYWQYVQAYFEGDLARAPKRGARSVTVRVSVRNVFDRKAVDYLRNRKAAVLRLLEGTIRHELQ